MAHLRQAEPLLLNLMLESIRKSIVHFNDHGPQHPPILFWLREREINTSFYSKSDNEACLDSMRQHIAGLEPRPKYYCFTFDGVIDLDGEELDAVIVRGFNRDKEEGYILIQPYFTDDFGLIQPFGAPAYAGTENNSLFAPSLV